MLEVLILDSAVRGALFLLLKEAEQDLLQNFLALFDNIVLLQFKQVVFIIIFILW